MSVELMQTVSTVCYVVAIMAFLGAAAIFVTFNIPAVFGRMTGRTARKGIAKILERGISRTTTSRKPTPRQTGSDKSRQTSSIPGSRQPFSVQTEVLQAPAVQQTSEQTTVLAHSSGVESRAESRSEAVNQTSVISSAFPDEKSPQESNAKMVILSEEQFLASNEIIL